MMVKLLYAAALLLAGAGLGILVNGVPAPAAVAPTSDPTATPIPTPEPTPVVITETVTETVYEAPPACREALQLGSALYAAALEDNLSILNAYLDYPEEDLLDFGRRVEGILDEWGVSTADLEERAAEYQAAAGECLGE